ncbi:hypothetical protein [Legionella cardiaca]|uniref:Uncharacterized protein n=1 Tax=Legionella cardiaca TaxID=1071983 RepID=A0ABY8AR46_9GAMM|nr:hypothetical protein [Legionella cardiaca]WED41995.1 hypothetical protein PXX05_08605 [Legionella cardiaca]
MEILISFYLIGFLVHLYRTYVTLIGFRNMKQTLSVDMFKERPELMRYLAFKVVFWPYYFVTEKSPLERISETFFKHYGDQGCRYYGTRGITNFFNDLTKGKKRYQHYKIQHFVWKLDSPLYPKDNSDVKVGYAEIILAVHKDHCLFQMVLTDKPFRSRGKISRYMLDGCEKLSHAEVSNRLKTINVEEFEKFRFPGIKEI